MKSLNIATIRDPDLRLSAELLDQTVAGDRDGTITSAEVDRAIEVADNDPRLANQPAVRANLQRLKQYLNSFGSDAGARPTNNRLPTGDVFNALGIQLSALNGNAKDPAILLKNGEWETSVDHFFEVPYADRKVRDGQAVLIPLEPRALFGIELEYQDTRKLKDLEFNSRQPGDYNWASFRGDKWFDMVDEEFSGNAEIKRDGFTDAPFVNNPVKVKIEVLYPNGSVFEVGEKTIRFNVNDAFDTESSGYPSTDTISNNRENLPRGSLPDGCMLRLTPRIVNKKSWEKLRNVAADLAWVKPIYVP